MQGADPTALESKIQQYYGSDDGEEGEAVAGHVGVMILKHSKIIKMHYYFFSSQMDLSPFILKQQCECLNESDEHPFQHCLTSSGGFLQSDCDEQVRFL